MLRKYFKDNFITENFDETQYRQIENEFIFFMNPTFSKLRKSKKIEIKIEENGLPKLYKDTFINPTQGRLIELFKMPIIQYLWSNFYTKSQGYQELKEKRYMHM